jgi:hypothetical protein
MLVVSFGGGTNSTAMLIEMVKREIKPDLILFSDVGAELPETYCHTSRFSAWLEGKGFPEITYVHAVNKDGDRLLLEQECLERKCLPSIAYGFKSCSQKYKIAPVDKFLNNHEQSREVWKIGEKVVKYVGFDLDEEHRIKNHDDDKYQIVYPLVDWEMGRDECIKSIKSAGLPLPGKSACFFCPSAKKRDIRDLKHKHPELLKRAIALEDNAQENLGSVKGLGRNFAWKNYAAQGELFPELFPEPYIEKSCGCYDGYAA